MVRRLSYQYQTILSSAQKYKIIPKRTKICPYVFTNRENEKFMRKRFGIRYFMTIYLQVTFKTKSNEKYQKGMECCLSMVG